MLRPLRWKLTLLYLITAIGLVGLMGFGTYLLIDRYFQQTTDLTLQYKMATEFHLLGLDVPPELLRSEALWLQNNSRGLSQPSPTVIVPAISSSSDDDHDGSEGSDESENSNLPGEYHSEDDHLYNADLAAVFVISLDEDGKAILAPNLAAPPTLDTPEALANALQFGYDLRTIDQPGRGRIRLLTYRTNGSIPALLQTGRLLNDQDRVLAQYLIYLAILGGAASFLLAIISWWLAGRSLGPAQTAWDQQQTFVSNASHELRTPLTLIRATADYGLRGKPAKAQARHLTDILNECDYMDHLVDDLLLLSRLDAHRLKLELKQLSIPELFTDTIRQVTKLAQTENISVSSEGYTGNILGDPTRMRQVLLILLDNALRFTPSGGTIRLSAKQAGKSVLLEVADTGKGIEPEHLPHLFERFYQIGTPENESNRSNGLGLSIARALVEAQDGKIRIDSQPGKGTKVRITMPAP
jgi:signal transduction histidine kinase